jgi:hypothetical protein
MFPDQLTGGKLLRDSVELVVADSVWAPPVASDVPEAVVGVPVL